MRSCFCKMRWNEIRMRSHLYKMRSVFHEMRQNRIRTEAFSCKMRLRNHKMRQNRIRTEALSCEMRLKIFLWDEMRSNLCEMRASDLTSSQNQNQNETRSWWNESSHSDFTISLINMQLRYQIFSSLNSKKKNLHAACLWYLLLMLTSRISMISWR
jgi:hypothetical protein